MNAYEIGSGELLASVSVPGAHDPAFTEDGSQLIFAGAQSGVVAFDTNTWEKRWTIGVEQLPGAVAILSLDVAGDRAFLMDPSGLTFGITLDHGQLLDLARDRLGRSFTDQECEIYRIDPCLSLDEFRSQ